MDLLGIRFDSQRPVNRRVAPATDGYHPILEGLRLADKIMKRFTFEVWRLGQVQFTRTEGSVANSDNNCTAKMAGLWGLNFIVGFAILIFMLNQLTGFLASTDGGVEVVQLLNQRLGEVAPLDLVVGRNIVDGLRLRKPNLLLRSR